jgi:signal transduction histidine kinase
MVAFGYLLYLLNTNKNYAQNEVKAMTTISNYSYELFELQKQIEEEILSYRLKQNPIYLKNVSTSQQEIYSYLDKIDKLVSNEKGRKLLDQYRLARKGIEDVRSNLIKAINSGNVQQIETEFSVWLTRKQAIDESLENFVDYNLSFTNQLTNLLQQITQQIAIAATLILFLTIVLLAILFIYIRYTITRPIKELSLAANRIAHGEFETPISFKSNDEIGQLAASLQNMSKRLAQFYKNLEQQFEEKDNELTKTKELEKRKDEFLGMASHELKTPMTSLRVFSQLLKKRAASCLDAEARHFLTKMDSQIDKLTALIKELLDVSRIQAGKLNLLKEEFLLKELVNDIAENIQTTTSSHHIFVEGKVNEKILADKERIGQVLTNLLINAIKYSPQAEKVVVSLTGNSQTARVEVRDFGIGIAKRHQKKIFERFYQVAEGKSEPYSGLGIGLYIASKIVKRHGGKIGVKSVAGKGSTFYFTLPLR